MTRCWKRAYPDEQSARAHLGALWRQASRDECDVYQCPRCGAWHLTSTEPRARTRRGAAA